MKWRGCIAVLPFTLLGEMTAGTEAHKEFFEARIRPVLAQSCFGCHTSSRMAGLRLDSRENILKGGKSGPAVTPGEPEKSLLMRAIRQTGGLSMPKGGVPLTEAQIADFAIWIKDGAAWPVESVAQRRVTDAERRFWSIQPLKPPAGDIDRFVFARLAKEGLTPSPAADKRTLLRRVSYGVTGLPPSQDEVQAFEADKSPNAYKKVVDRLLASPRYGETWARHWMDVVRYGEDDYNVGAMPDRAEKYPHAYHYRDWLIKSINEDLRYGDFIKAQLAADLMDPKIRDRMIPALGMHGTGTWKFEANIAVIERADEWADKVDVTTKAFLGLTVGCARCHDHKYDPIPTKDYYRLAGVFASTRFKAYPLAPKAVVDEQERQKKELEAKEAALKKFLDNAASLYAQMLFSQTEPYMVAAWRVGAGKRVTAASVAEKEKLDVDLLDRWIRFLKKTPHNYTFLKPWQEMVAHGGTEEQARKLAAEFHALVSKINEEFLKLKHSNEVELAKVKNDEEQFDPLPNRKKQRLNKYQITLKGLDREQNYLWRDIFEKDLRENPDNPDLEEDKQPGLLKMDGWALEKRLSPDLAAHLAKLKAGIEDFKKSMAPHYPFVYGLEEGGEPVDLKVYLRGNPFTFGEDAPRAFLSMLSADEPAPFRKGSGRMELAESIVRHPITARVLVNRLWQWHMGAPLVDTPNNFGLVGGKPSNPELLEYLAAKFVEGGMSWKKMHREILLSRAYQMSSQGAAGNSGKDPANRLHWRANRRRLEAEGVWDSLLAASGKLDLSRLGGPSEELGPKMTRRGVYAKVSRMYPNDVHVTFDFPTPTISAEKRYATNVPQQRLFFLNSEFVHAQAAGLAARVSGAGDPQAQVTRLYQFALQRTPLPDELAAAVELLKEGAKKPDSPLKSLCWALLSSNEFLYLD